MSKYEGSSRILLESLYIGLICISNNIPGTNELSSKFSNSFFVNDNNIQEFRRNLNEIINNDAFLDSTQNEYFGNGADYNRKLINENYTNHQASQQLKLLLQKNQYIRNYFQLALEVL